MAPRRECTNEAFDEKLEELVGRMTPEAILAIPGVYEVLSEALNNDVLEELGFGEEGEEEEEDMTPSGLDSDPGYDATNLDDE